MAASGPTRGALRQAIASLLRLAIADAADARRLLEAGSTRNAALLLRRGITRAVEAVVASEQGYTAPAETARIDRRNPLKPELEALDDRPAEPEALQRGGRLAAPPAGEALADALGRLDALLARLAGHFALEIEGGGPAGSAAPLRPAPPPTSPALLPPPAAVRAPRRTAAGPAPARRPARQSASSPPAPRAEPAPRAAAGLSSTTLWSLADRWKLADAAMLAILGDAPAPGRTGARPRFRLSPAQKERLGGLLALEDAMRQLGLDPAGWLAAPLRPAPFHGASPAALLARGGAEALREVGRAVTALALQRSAAES